MHRPSASVVAALAIAALAVLLPPASASPRHPAARSTPVNGSTPPAEFPMVAAAGDIACDPSSDAFRGLRGRPGACRMRYTSDLLVHARDRGNLAAVLTLGDSQYYCGGYRPYLRSFDPTWGRLKAITHPTPGTH